MNPDDPRLTAYALGEPLSEKDRLEVEAALAQAPELRDDCGETQNLARLLEGAFSEEALPPAALSRVRPSNVIDFPGAESARGPVDDPAEADSPAAPPEAVPPPRRKRRFDVWSFSACAATAALFALLGLAILKSADEIHAFNHQRDNIAKVEEDMREARRDQLVSRVKDLRATLEEKYAQIAAQEQALSEITTLPPFVAAAPAPGHMSAENFSANRMLLEKTSSYYGDLELDGQIEAVSGSLAVLDRAHREADKRLDILEAEIAEEKTKYFALQQGIDENTQLLSQINRLEVELVMTEAKIDNYKAAIGTTAAATTSGTGKAEEAAPPSSTSVARATGNPLAEHRQVAQLQEAERKRRILLAEIANRLRDMNNRGLSFAAVGKSELAEVVGVSAEDVSLKLTRPIYQLPKVEAYKTLPLPAPGDNLIENPFLSPGSAPLSSFGLVVDSTSYAQTREALRNGRLPDRNDIRVEELLNHFSYEHPAPWPGEAMSLNAEVAPAPWNAEHQLLRIGVRTRDNYWKNRRSANIVFVVDASAAMDQPNRLPLIRESLKLAIQELDLRDRVAIVTCGATSEVLLPPTHVNHHDKIDSALRMLRPQGNGTSEGQAILDGYREAWRSFLPGANNRVVLCTDGNLNLSGKGHENLLRLVKAGAERNILLTAVGYGLPGRRNETIEALGRTGRGMFGYIDSLSEARKVFADMVAGVIDPVALAARAQVEFNPATVAAYRLIGYETNLLAPEEFSSYSAAGPTLASGRTLTALYEIVPVRHPQEPISGEGLKYQNLAAVSDATGQELLTLRVRWKDSASGEDRERDLVVENGSVRPSFEEASVDFRFASAVAAWGMHLRQSPYLGDISLRRIQNIARNAKGTDWHRDRQEFVELVGATRLIANQ